MENSDVYQSRKLPKWVRLMGNFQVKLRRVNWEVIIGRAPSQRLGGEIKLNWGGIIRVEGRGLLGEPN